MTKGIFNSRMGTMSVTASVIIILALTSISDGQPAQKKRYIVFDPDPELPYALDHSKEFREFCEKQEMSRRLPEKIGKHECKKIDEREFHNDDLAILFMVFVILLYGAIIRSIIKRFHITLPYTVFMMTSGVAVGFAAKYYCYELYTFSAISRLNAKIYLFTFLPVLLFESSFSISGHVFVKAAGQVLLLAAPGMIMCTLLTAFVCFTFFTTYEWTFLEAVFFGSIISATDPVAVVAILKELGVAETLSVLIDGESLLNDGVAILLYEVLHGLLIHNDHPGDTGTLITHIFQDFLRIAVGGPVFGWFMAKLTIFSLNRVFNDAVVEITATIVATYLTYYIGEAVLGVSGVMAVVILGITMSSEKTCISPETEHELHDFWGMLGFLANTVLFFVTGIIITERGSRGVAWVDLYYLILLYFSLNLIRFMMLMLFSPLLSRIGYGMNWENMIVMMWGGLRGAVGVCLALEVYEDIAFCKNEAKARLGPKVLIQTAGIVFLTLVVNGTTTKKLLDVLKLTEISAGRMDEMKNAIKTMHLAQKKALLMLRHDRFLADANWAYVAEKTKIDDPYKDRLSSQRKKPEVTSIVSLTEEQATNECPECHAHVENIPTNEELRNMTDEARLRVIKAMKISYWAHFERGVLTEVAVQLLAGTADSCADREMYMIHTRDLKKYWEIRGIWPWLRSRLVQQLGEGTNIYNFPPPPTEKWKYYLWWLATKPLFDHIVTIIVILNMIPAIWQLALESNNDPCRFRDSTQIAYDQAFRLTNFAFTLIYAVEFIVKTIGLGAGNYWKSRWNWLDVSVLVVSIMDVVLSLFNICGSGSRLPHHLVKIVKIVRCFRCIKLIRPLTPLIMDNMNGKINDRLFLGYDVALGFIMGCDDVLKFLPHMIDNKRVYNKIRLCIERERMAAICEMGILQKKHPGIAIAIKTRHASRSVLNQMKSTLGDLRSDGLLDEKENDLLTIALEERMKNLQFSPNYITPPAPETVLENLNWVFGHDELRDFIFEHATLLQYEEHDVIYAVGDPPNGIHVIVSGMIRIRYVPDEKVKQAREKYGVIPNMEIFKEFDLDKEQQDLLSSGTVIGESSSLTGRNRMSSVTCETEGVTAFHIPQSAIQKALETFTDKYNSLEERLWRSCGMRRGGWFLQTHPLYQTYSKEKIATMLERSCSPIGPQFEVIRIPPYVQDVIVTEGWVEDGTTGELYIAPALIPRTCKSIKNRPNPMTMNRILVVLAENKNPDADDSDELAKCLMAAKKNRKISLDTDYMVRDEQTDDSKQKRVSVTLSFGVQGRRGSKSRKSLAAGYDPRRRHSSEAGRKKSLVHRKGVNEHKERKS